MRLGGGLAIAGCALALAPAASAQTAALSISGPSAAPFQGDAYSVTLSGTVPPGEDPARLASLTQPAGPCAAEPGAAPAGTVAGAGDFSSRSQRPGAPPADYTICAWLSGASGSVIATASLPITVRPSRVAISAPATIQQEHVMPGLPGAPVRTPQFRYALSFETGRSRMLGWVAIANGETCPMYGVRQSGGGSTSVSASGQHTATSPTRVPEGATRFLLCGYVGTLRTIEATAQQTVTILPPVGPAPDARIRILSLRRDGRAAVGWADCHCRRVVLDARSGGRRHTVPYGIPAGQSAGVRRIQVRLPRGRWTVRALLYDRLGRPNARSARRIFVAR